MGEAAKDGLPWCATWKDTNLLCLASFSQVMELMTESGSHQTFNILFEDVYIDLVCSGFCPFDPSFRAPGQGVPGFRGGLRPVFWSCFLFLPSDQLTIRGNVVSLVSLAKRVSPKFNSYVQFLLYIAHDELN